MGCWGQQRCPRAGPDLLHKRPGAGLLLVPLHEPAQLAPSGPQGVSRRGHAVDVPILGLLIRSAIARRPLLHKAFNASYARALRSRNGSESIGAPRFASGLQIRVRRFDSDPGLHLKP